MYIRRVPWTRQPQVPVEIDWSNPITAGLSYASAIGVGSNLVTTQAGTVTRTARVFGLVDSFTPGSSKTVNKSSVGKSQKGTVVILHRSTVLPPNGPTTYSHILATTSDGVSYSPNGWFLMLSNGSGVPSFVVSGGAGAQYSANASIALNDGLPHVTAAYYNAAAGGVMGIYTDGKQTASGIVATAVTIANPIRWGGDRGTFWGSFEGDIGAAMFFDRILSDAEIKELSNNPWQIFRPQSRPIFFSASGGSSTNLILPNALHSHLATSPSLSLNTTLNTNNAKHTLTTININLNTSSILTIANAIHSLLTANLTLNTLNTTNLDIQNAIHSLISTNLVLSSSKILAINNSLHTVISNNVTLAITEILTLIVQNALHAHKADNNILDTSNSTILNTQNSRHLSSSSNLVLNLLSTLSVNNALHGLINSSVSLTTDLTLATSNSNHALTSSILVLSIPGVGGTCPTVDEIVAAIMIQMDLRNYLTVPKFLALK